MESTVTAVTCHQRQWRPAGGVTVSDGSKPHSIPRRFLIRSAPVYSPAPLVIEALLILSQRVNRVLLDVMI
jgi:hypothetical protein